MSGLLIRDNRVQNLALRDGGQPLNALQLAGASYFTEGVDMGTFSEGIMFLFPNNHAGTNPTLDVKLQYSPDNLHWVDSGDAFTQITTSGDAILVAKKMTANFGKWVRCIITIGGTGSPSYKVSLWIVGKA